MKRLPSKFCEKYKEILWRIIAGMRDIAVHNYETMDKLIPWNVADKETEKKQRVDSNIDIIVKTEDVAEMGIVEVKFA